MKKSAGMHPFWKPATQGRDLKQSVNGGYIMDLLSIREKIIDELDKCYNFTLTINLGILSNKNTK
jgi:hypothetical protein